MRNWLPRRLLTVVEPAAHKISFLVNILSGEDWSRDSSLLSDRPSVELQRYSSVKSIHIASNVVQNLLRITLFVAVMIRMTLTWPDCV